MVKAKFVKAALKKVVQILLSLLILNFCHLLKVNFSPWVDVGGCQSHVLCLQPFNTFLKLVDLVKLLRDFSLFLCFLPRKCVYLIRVALRAGLALKCGHFVGSCFEICLQLFN